MIPPVSYSSEMNRPYDIALETEEILELIFKQEIDDLPSFSLNEVIILLQYIGKNPKFFFTLHPNGVTDDNEYRWMILNETLGKIAILSERHSNYSLEDVTKVFYQCLLTLLFADFDFDHEIKWMQTRPLHYAISIGANPLVQALLHHIANPKLGQTDRDGLSALHIACRFSRIKIIRQLLEQGMSVNRYSTGLKSTPLFEGAHDPEVIALLAEHGVNIDQDVSNFVDGPKSFYRAIRTAGHEGYKAFSDAGFFPGSGDILKLRMITYWNVHSAFYLTPGETDWKKMALKVAFLLRGRKQMEPILDRISHIKDQSLRNDEDTEHLKYAAKICRLTSFNLLNAHVERTCVERFYHSFDLFIQVLENT